MGQAIYPAPSAFNGLLQVVPPISPTWSLTNKNGHIGLSGDSLTATTDGALGDAAGIATAAITSGKQVYWEVTLGTASTGGENAVGIANASFTFGDNNWLGIDANSLAVYSATGNLYMGGSNLGSLLAFAAGHTVGIAVSRPNSKFWIIDITAGQSFGGAYDPATNSGGFVHSITGDLFPAYNLGAASSTVTANFGATVFAGSVPGTFTKYGA